MEKIDRFNIRVYALCIEDEKILTLFKSYAGEKLIKLSGGRLEFGEGIIDCLHREFMDELNVKIEVLNISIHRRALCSPDSGTMSSL